MLKHYFIIWTMLLFFNIYSFDQQDFQYLTPAQIEQAKKDIINLQGLTQRHITDIKTELQQKKPIYDLFGLPPTSTELQANLTELDARLIVLEEAYRSIEREEKRKIVQQQCLYIALCCKMKPYTEWMQTILQTYCSSKFSQENSWWLLPY